MKTTKAEAMTRAGCGTRSRGMTMLPDGNALTAINAQSDCKLIQHASETQRNRMNVTGGILTP
jgi:hypothetical protein